jgi:hypothetical protein
MVIKDAAERLARGRDSLRTMAANVTDEQARWRPAPDKWSILEVICHMHDEEVSDFRLRLHILLNRPADPWPPVDPQAWALEKKYNDRRLFESLETLTVERNKSIEWLQQLKDPDLTVARDHPRLGPIHAGDLLAAWVAHDYLHLAQLARLHAAYVAEVAVPYSTRYASP